MVVVDECEYKKSKEDHCRLLRKDLQKRGKENDFVSSEERAAR